jgi:hypothetical protein
MTIGEAIQNALDFIVTMFPGSKGGDVYQDLKRAQLTLSLRDLSQPLRLPPGERGVIDD